jgi:hypothetical protein
MTRIFDVRGDIRSWLTVLHHVAFPPGCRDYSIPEGLAESAVDIIQQLLQMDAEKRLGSDDIASLKVRLHCISSKPIYTAIMC